MQFSKEKKKIKLSLHQNFYLYSVCCGLEICLPIDCFSILDRPEQDDAGQGVAGDEEEHAHDDEEALVHAHEHGLHQHLQRRVLARDREETENDDDVAQR